MTLKLNKISKIRCDFNNLGGASCYIQKNTFNLFLVLYRQIERNSHSYQGKTSKNNCKTLNI
jgi:hypothetical protein